MATAFTRSLHALGADRFRGTFLAMLGATLILGCWLAWSFLGRVSLFEVTESARIEAGRAIHPVEAPISGRVTQVNLIMGREVKPGDPLVEVEADGQQLELQQERTRLLAIEPELRALRGQLTSEELTRKQEQEHLAATVEEARALLRQNQAPSRYADEESERLARLRKEGLVSERDHSKGQADAQKERGNLETLGASINRLERERTTKDAERAARIQQLRTDVARLEGQAQMSDATINRLKFEVQRRTIRAAVGGRLGDVAILRLGAYVAAGQRLAAIIPSGDLVIIADFPPAGAIGRIRAGQPARLRLAGYPWAQYGSVPARVMNVASEIRDGKVRVELAIEGRPESGVPLQHGLPGAVEVEVERIAPATLLLRNAGKLLATPVAAAN